ncbi:hypothetical protein F2Q69_00043749 [Brassica cretica]|uniref:Uncharacterized protein n=1 Tax=Brassica cretica TaxID=69181 RepID=A0A8S9NCT4_BRACR|nr:hypothetical protein F2Q69_00043749 [Brassica cretica]
MCVNLVNRTVEVFDCGGKKNNKAVEAFVVLIPQIVKAVQSSDRRKISTSNKARHKIAFDLWEAANDEALQYRMSTFKPPKRVPEKTVELF